MDKICLIKQPAGIGDIFFCQKIAKTIQETTQYKKVFWPVKEVYSYLNDYIQEDGITFCVESEDFPYKEIYNLRLTEKFINDDLYFLPLQTANTGRCSCHGSWQADGHMKYDFAGMTYQNWKDYFNFKRDYSREESLIKHLNLDDGEEYNLVNVNYGTYPDFAVRLGINPENGLKNVYMNFNPNYNLFDWIGVAERAKEIHSVEGSLFYLLEKMNFSDNIYIYSRPSHAGDNFAYVDGIFNKNWSYIN